MKFSTRLQYGLKAVLVLASRHGQGSLSVSQIAKKEGISVAYLEQILNALKRKGVVKSLRGPKGGYVLLKKPSEITLESLFYTLDEDARFLEKESAPSKTREPRDETGLAWQLFWARFKSCLSEGLGKSNLKDLLDQARRAARHSQSASYPFSI